jgi:bacteriocin biosynthesis cyclodehydratase domain-containing protein
MLVRGDAAVAAADRPEEGASRPPAATALPPVPRLPWLAPWHRRVRVPGRLVLEHAGQAVCLEGAAVDTVLAALLPQLDGTRTVSEVESTVGAELRPLVAPALALLAERGLLVDGPPLAGVGRGAAQTALTLAAHGAERSSPAATAERLERLRVRVLGRSETAERLLELLRVAGVGEAAAMDWRAPAGDVLVLAAPTTGELSRLRDWNRRALAAGTAWLQVLPYDGAVLVVGPLYLPGQTCCYECYRRRRASNLAYAEEVELLEDATGEWPTAPPLAALAAGLATTLALRWLVLRDPLVAGAVAVIELGLSFRAAVHEVFPVPRCPVCRSVARTAAPLPWAEAS